MKPKIKRPELTIEHEQKKDVWSKRHTANTITTADRILKDSILEKCLVTPYLAKPLFHPIDNLFC